MKVRTIHRRLGISIAFFLLVQALAGMLMSAGKLASADNSKVYQILYVVHADWDPPGSIYRAALGLAIAAQAILGIMIFLRSRRMTSAASSTTPHVRPVERKEETSMATLSFAADIRPLFREKDVSAMKPAGIDLSSYEDVKKRAADIYSLLSAGEMPCDGSWSNDRLRKFKEWMESGMQA
jgi:succinate dehydrogenase/fumarate reductase cytochrome b subunit